MPEVAARPGACCCSPGHLAAAAHLAQMHELPMSQARVLPGPGSPSPAFGSAPLPRPTAGRGQGWEDERLRVMVLQALALQAHGEKDKAAQLLGDALALAEPGGFIRLFVDEGLPMATSCPKQRLSG